MQIRKEITPAIPSAPISAPSERTPSALGRVLAGCITPADIAWANKQAAFPHSHSMPRKAINWCPELGMYVQENWKPRTGSSSSNCQNLVAAYQAESLRELEEALAFQRKNPKRYDLNRHETSFIKRGRVYISSLQGLETAGGTTNPNRAANERFRAEQAWKRIPPTKANCLACVQVFQARKGTRFCSGNCRKRHHEHRSTRVAGQ